MLAFPSPGSLEHYVQFAEFPVHLLIQFFCASPHTHTHRQHQQTTHTKKNVNIILTSLSVSQMRIICHRIIYILFTTYFWWLRAFFFVFLVCVCVCLFVATPHYIVCNQKSDKNDFLIKFTRLRRPRRVLSAVIEIPGRAGVYASAHLFKASVK